MSEFDYGRAVMNLAKATLRWHADDIFSFMWGHEMVFSRYDRERDGFWIISYHKEETRQDIYNFIRSDLIEWLRNNPNPDGEIDEENWD